jgi:Concanavalin A-like lectin/glucanases superfamily
MNLVLAPRWASSSLQFSGQATVDAGNNSVLKNLTSFTLEAWVNPANLTGFQSIVSNADNGGGQYQLYLSDGFVVAFAGIAPYVVQSPTAITANAWHHLAATFDGVSGTFTLYVDGNPVAQTILKGSLPTAAQNTLIGVAAQNGFPTWFFQGQMGRVSIWNSVRSAEDILNDSVQVNIYKATENTDLVLHVDFSQMPSVDASGNNNVLKQNGTQYLFNVPSVVLGNTGYVNCGSYPEYSLPGNAPYTIEGWFFPTANNAGTLVSYGLNGQWEYQVRYQNSQVIARRNSDALQITSSASVVPNSYYHFAVTYDNTVNALSLYINGNLQCVDYFPSPVTAVPNGQVLIGAMTAANGGQNDFFGGAIQNLRLWNVCLEQSEIYQWMYNDVLNDSRLISNYDFTVNPPIDTTDTSQLQLLGGAAQTLQSVAIPLTEPIAQLGLPKSINAIYLNQNPETPVSPTSSQVQTPPAVRYTVVPEMFSDEHKEKSWSDFVAFTRLKGNDEKKPRLRKQFEEGYQKAQDIMQANPKLKQVFTRTDAKGMTRIVHHGIKGDTLVYEGAVGAVSDCTLWWIQFVFALTVGFYQALGLLPTTGDIATRIYNLVRNNAAAWAALTSMVGKSITATAAIGFMGVVYQQGLMWTLIKFILTSAGWYALFWVLRKVIAIVTGLEAASILAGFIVWAAQLTQLSLQYGSKCNDPQCEAEEREGMPAYA